MPDISPARTWLCLDDVMLFMDGIDESEDQFALRINSIPAAQRNAFDGFGDYMNAKTSKLQDQFLERAKQREGGSDIFKNGKKKFFIFFSINIRISFWIIKNTKFIYYFK